MSNEALLKTGLIVTVFVALLIYHVTSYFFPANEDLFSLYKIAQMLILGLFIIFSISTQYIPRLLPGAGFIGGTYTGTSEMVRGHVPIEKEAPHQEEFEIKQTLFETTIHGTSKKEGKVDLYSSWNGRRFHVDHDTHYFGLIMDLSLIHISEPTRPY